MYKLPLTVLKAKKIQLKELNPTEKPPQVKVVCPDKGKTNRYNSEATISIQGFFKEEFYDISTPLHK